MSHNTQHFFSVKTFTIWQKKEIASAWVVPFLTNEPFPNVLGRTTTNPWQGSEEVIGDVKTLSTFRGHSNNMWHFRGEGGVSENVTWQFLLVISLVKVDKTWGSKKCGKSVTYYLNGPIRKQNIIERFWMFEKILSSFILRTALQYQMQQKWIIKCAKDLFEITRAKVLWSGCEKYTQGSNVLTPSITRWVSK
jgi:hypothetical protein